MKGALAFQFAVDAVALDKRHHQRRPVSEHGQQTLAIQFAGRRRDIVRHQPQTGIDESHVAARPAKAKLVRLQQNHGFAGLGKMQRAGQSGITAADDDDIRFRRLCQR
jgi:hypothetical protein